MAVEPWQNARDEIAALIRGGWPERDPLPSMYALAQTHEVPVHVVRRALEALRAEGVIESRPRVGWFVVGEPARSDRERLTDLEQRVSALESAPAAGSGA